VNLLRLLRGDLRGLDLSRLAIRHAYLQGVDAQDASLAGAQLAQAVLAEAFAYPTAVALSADGAFVGMSSFGASAPYKDLYRHFGVTSDAVAQAALGKLGRN